MKILLLFLAILAAVLQSTHCQTLRRKPKVYNALITTDQNLTPSRAFPVIQPHLQETYAYPSYSYRSYPPLGLYNGGFQYGSAAGSYNGFHRLNPGIAPRYNPGIVEARNFYSRDDIHTTLPPILNDFGLPPSLIPINSFAFGNLAPYPYSSYPIAYDQFGGYGGYLPPYPFYPPGFDASDKRKNDAGKDGDEKKDSPDDGNKSGNDSGNGSSGGGNGSSGGGNGNSVGGSGSSGGGSSGSGNSGGGSGASGGGNSGGGSGNSGGGSGSSGGGSFGGNSGSSGGSSGSSGGSSGSSGGSNGGTGGNSGSSSSSSTSSSTKSSRSRNFDKVQHPQQQSLSENIKNFPNKDPSIPDIDPSPPVRVRPLNN